MLSELITEHFVDLEAAESLEEVRIPALESVMTPQKS